MFNKKKDKKETPTSVPVKRVPQFYDNALIRAAIERIKDALETGQIAHKVRFTGETYTLVAVPSSHPSTFGDGYAFMASSYYGLPILDQMEIKSKDQIEKEAREAKQKELEKLQACQAKDLAEIERLARELGNKT